MATAPAAGALAAGPEPPADAETSRTSRFALALAGSQDDAEICALLAWTPFPGDVQVSLERAPSPTAAGTIDGDVHQLITVRERVAGALLGMASRSERDVYVNGSVVRAGYLGQLRVDRSQRAWRRLLEEGFSFCRDLHDRGGAQFYLTSVVSDNGAARRLLEGRLIRSAPRFVPIGRLRTFAIATSDGPGMPGASPCTSALKDRPASSSEFVDVIACLQRNLCRYQLAPHWTAADFDSDRTRGLRPEHFVLAMRGDRVVGCLARWDQTAFKQIVIRGYSRQLARWRPLINAIGPWCGVPALPRVGATLRCAYLSHAAVDDDRPDVFAALVRAQCGLARAAGIDYVIAGVPGDHPFHAVLTRGFRSRTYDSVLYIGSWDDVHGAAAHLVGRRLQPEVAVL